MDGTAPRNLVITGASSGIGRALALEYAAPRSAIGLVGRDACRLEQVAAACRARGAEPTIGVIDVRDRAGLAAWLLAFDEAHAIDLLVANAGVLVRMSGGQIEPADEAHALIQINVLGVQNTVQPIMPRMISRNRGQIALIASVAAFTPLPHSPSYSASKAAVLNYGLSLRAVLARHGVRLSVVCNGFVETGMTADIKDPMPFSMSAEKAAGIMRRGLERDRAVVMFPTVFAALSRIDGLLPDRVRRFIYDRSARGRASAVSR